MVLVARHILSVFTVSFTSQQYFCPFAINENYEQCKEIEEVIEKSRLECQNFQKKLSHLNFVFFIVKIVTIVTIPSLSNTLLTKPTEHFRFSSQISKNS